MWWFSKMICILPQYNTQYMYHLYPPKPRPVQCSLLLIVHLPVEQRRGEAKWISAAGKVIAVTINAMRYCKILIPLVKINTTRYWDIAKYCDQNTDTCGKWKRSIPQCLQFCKASVSSYIFLITKYFGLCKKWLYCLQNWNISKNTFILLHVAG